MNNTDTILRLLQDSDGGNEPYCVPEPVGEIAWYNYAFIVILATMSGLFSGLNLGLLGLDVKNLELLTRGPF